MEKVSRIIPSNARIESVDLSKAKPGRGKLPGVDDEIVKHSKRLPGSELSAVERLSRSEEYNLLKPDEARKAAIAQKITDKFFKIYNGKAEINDMHNNSTEQENLKLNNESENEEIQESNLPVKKDLIPETEQTINSGEHISFSKYA